MVTLQLQVEHRMESSPARDRRSTTVPRSQPINNALFTFIIILEVSAFSFLYAGHDAYTPCPVKKEASSFSTISLAFLDQFS